MRTGEGEVLITLGLGCESNISQGGSWRVGGVGVTTGTRLDRRPWRVHWDLVVVVSSAGQRDEKSRGGIRVQGAPSFVTLTPFLLSCLCP